MLQQDITEQSVPSKDSESSVANTDDNVNHNCGTEPDRLDCPEVVNGDNDQLVECQENSKEVAVKHDDEPVNDEDPVNDDVTNNTNENIVDSVPVTVDDDDDNNDVNCDTIQPETENNSESPDLGITSDHNYEDKGEDEIIEIVAPDVQCENTESIEEDCKEHIVSEETSPLETVKGNSTEEVKAMREDLDNPLSSNGDSVETEIKKDLIHKGKSSEYPQCEPQDTSDRENKLHIHSENSYVTSVGQYSWGGKIRSVSARRPVRKPSVPPENLPDDVNRSSTPRKVGSSENLIDSDPSSRVSGTLFSSLKRKAFEMDCSMSSKRQKVNGSQNSTFFSMVSSPLRLFRNKASDRVIESPKVEDEKNVNGNSEDESEKCGIGSEIKDKNMLTSEHTNVNPNLIKSWCTVM